MHIAYVEFIYDHVPTTASPNDLRGQFFKIVYRLHTCVGGPEIWLEIGFKINFAPILIFGELIGSTMEQSLFFDTLKVDPSRF